MSAQEHAVQAFGEEGDRFSHVHVSAPRPRRAERLVPERVGAVDAGGVPGPHVQVGLGVLGATRRPAEVAVAHTASEIEVWATGTAAGRRVTPSTPRLQSPTLRARSKCSGHSWAIESSRLWWAAA